MAPPPAVRFGFLGAGHISRTALAPAVHAASGAVLQAAAARDRDRAAALEPAGSAYGRYEDLLADPTVDVVYVGLDNRNHHPWTLAALRAGKHVLCEKPLALDPHQVAEMVDTAHSAGRLLVEAFWYRWHPRTRRLAELLEGGALGAVRGIDAEFSFAGDWSGDAAGNFRLDPADGGGALYDVGCYAVSAVHLVLGTEPAVESASVRRGPSGVDWETAATLRCGGATAQVRCAIEGRSRQALAVDAEGALLEFGAGEAFANRDAASSLLITTPDRARREEHFAPVDPYRLMVESVAAAVRGEPALLVDAAHSLAVARTLQAIRDAGQPG